MIAPWYLYLFGLLVALPVYILLAVGLFGLARTVLVWAFYPTPETQNTKK